MAGIPSKTRLELVATVARASTTAAESTGDDYLVLDLESGRYYGLDEVAGFVWERLDGVRDLGSIAVELASYFDVGEAQAGRDIVAFVSELVEAGLAQLVPG